MISKTETNINISQIDIQKDEEYPQQAFLKENELAYKILDRLYECRNLEINNLWQRSAFLIGILLLIYTGYGVLLLNTFKSFNLEVNAINLPANILGLAISLLGIIFSTLWIKMGKGSKAWYEVYENYIAELDNKLSNSEGANILDYKASYFSMGKMNTFVNDNILHTNAGAYSPSKINIVIGQYSLIIFSVTFIIHAMLCENSYYCSKNEFRYCSTIIILSVLFFKPIIKWLFAKTKLGNPCSKKCKSLLKSAKGWLVNIKRKLECIDYTIENELTSQREKLELDINNAKNSIEKFANQHKIKHNLISFYLEKEHCTPQDLRSQAKELYKSYEAKSVLEKKALEVEINDLCYKIFKANYNPNSFMSTKSNFLGQ